MTLSGGPARVRPLIAAIVVAGALFAGAATSQPLTVGALTRWTGAVDLYRAGVFSTQQTWLWCTAADVQMIRNISRHEADHSRASQGRYFDFMRAHNLYRIPVRDGVDPGGWTAGLRRYVDARYRLVASPTFDAALRSAVTSFRRTNLPVAITVAHGDHAWVLTGFTATADPATTSRFAVTSVRVTGPLWGLQSRSYGYDMKPDTKLTPRQLAGFFTPWHYAGVHMAWEGRWVSIQPIPATPSRPSAAAAPKIPPATPKPAASAEVPATTSPAADLPPSASPGLVGVARPIDPSAGAAAPAPPVTDASRAASTSPAASWIMVAVAVALALAVLLLGVAVGRPARRQA